MHDQVLRFVQEHAVFFATVANVVGVFCGWLLRGSHVSTKVAEEAGKLEATIKIMAAQIAEQSEKLSSVSAIAEDEKRRRVETVEAIAIIERDRNGWRDRYWTCALGHSNLQTVLMREIRRLHAIVARVAPGKTQISTGLEQAVDNFSAEHVAKIPAEERRRIETSMRSNLVAPELAAGVISRPE